MQYLVMVVHGTTIIEFACGNRVSPFDRAWSDQVRP